MGLAFVNIENELSFQMKTSIPAGGFGPEISFKNKPLDFQYPSTEAVSSFLAVKLDANQNPIENITLSNLLITSDSVSHICDGLTDYATDLDCGDYYFLVNSKYQSETFRVFPDLIDSVSNQFPISVSGLGFVNINYETPYRKKAGAPDLNYARQYGENSTMLPFIYRATDSVTSIDLVEVDGLGVEVSTTSLSTALITSDGNYHTSTEGSFSFSCGTYFFRVNNKYESDTFTIVELDNVIQGIGYDIIESTLIVY